MFENFNYVPTLGIRPSEMEAAMRLPDFDKDLMLPSIRLRKWHTSHSLENSFTALARAVGERPVILDLAPPPGTVKSPCDARLLELHAADGGHREWVGLIAGHPNVLPTLQWGGDSAQTLIQAAAIANLGRPGVVLRLRRDHHWDLAAMAALAGFDFGAPLLIVLEYGLLSPRTDLTAAAAEIAGIANAAVAMFLSQSLCFTLAITSFPAEFASIDREHARLPIHERGLFAVLNAAAPFNTGATSLIYGDLASVCIRRSDIARGGAPRIDLACRNEWAYYRREEDHSYVEAAKAIMLDPAWQSNLFIWGTNEIRRAADGDLNGLDFRDVGLRYALIRICINKYTIMHRATC